MGRISMHGVIEMNLHLSRGIALTITELMKEGTITNTIGGIDCVIVMIFIEAEISIQMRVLECARLETGFILGQS